MAKQVELFGVKVRFGLYFLNVFQKEAKADNLQDLFQKLQNDVIGLIPIALMVAHNISSDKKINFEQACDLIDDNGGILGEEVKKFQEEMTSSLGTSLENEIASKKPSKKK